MMIRAVPECGLHAPQPRVPLNARCRKGSRAYSSSTPAGYHVPSVTTSGLAPPSIERQPHRLALEDRQHHPAPYQHSAGAVSGSRRLCAAETGPDPAAADAPPSRGFATSAETTPSPRRPGPSRRSARSGRPGRRSCGRHEAFIILGVTSGAAGGDRAAQRAYAAVDPYRRQGLPVMSSAGTVANVQDFHATHAAHRRKAARWSQHARGNPTHTSRRGTDVWETLGQRLHPPVCDRASHRRPAGTVFGEGSRRGVCRCVVKVGGLGRRPSRRS